MDWNNIHIIQVPCYTLNRPSRLLFHDSRQQQGEDAYEDARLYPLRFPVVYRPYFEERLDCPEGTLYLSLFIVARHRIVYLKICICYFQEPSCKLPYHTYVLLMVYAIGGGLLSVSVHISLILSMP